MKGKYEERKAFRTLDADRMDRFNVFILFLGLFNILVVIIITLLLFFISL